MRTSSAEIKCPLVLRRTAQPRFHLASVQPPVLKSLPRTLDTRNWTLSTTVLVAKKYKLPSRFKKLIDCSLAHTYSFAFIFRQNSLYFLRGYVSMNRGIRETMFLRVEIRDSALALKIFARITMISSLSNRTRFERHADSR